MRKVCDYCSGVYSAPCSTGRKYWQLKLYVVIRSHNDSESWAWATVTWRDTVDCGKTVPTESELKFFSQKNVGRANETSLEEQAYKEAKAKEKKMLDIGYTGPHGEQGDRAEHGLLDAMLARRWPSPDFIVPYAWQLQPKLDGVRCLTDGERFWTRGGKFFPEDALAHIKIDPAGLPDGCILDGELMMPVPKFSFQNSVSRAKRCQDDGMQWLLGYHVYDCYIESDPQVHFFKRIELIEELKRSGVLGENVYPVETEPLSSVLSLNNLHAHYVSLGYEGTMIRNSYSIYEPGVRSHNLLKNKDFFSTENREEDDFLIVGVMEGKGKDAGHAIFQCLANNGTQDVFRTRPEGDYAQRAEWWQQRDSLVGRKLTVRYQNLTDRGVPRFPVAVRVRDEIEGV